MKTLKNIPSLAYSSIYQIILKLIFLLCLFPVMGKSQTVTVDGNVFLQGQTNHSGIMVIFDRVAPSVLHDTAYTNSAGYFSRQINTGAWNISYHKNGFLSKYFPAQALYSDYTMADMAMEAAIYGPIKGTIKKGNYIVTSDLTVNDQDTLVIEAGTSLLFANGSKLIAYGSFIVNGTETDPVLFDWYITGTYWKGIKLLGINKKYVINFANINHSNNHGIELQFTKLLLNNCVIANNTSFASEGAGVKSTKSELEINKCIIRNNSCSGNGSGNNNGGGLYFSNGVLKVYQSNFNNNYADASGGAMFLDNADYTKGFCLIENCILDLNQSYGCGGIYTNWTDVTIKNTNFTRNRSNGYHGGALLHNSGNLKLYNSNFINNYCSRWGSAICAYNITMANNCFWNNVAGWNYIYYGNLMDWFGKIVTTNANGHPIDAYGNIFLDPKFSDFTNSNFHLTGSSPCINGGTIDTTGIKLPPTDMEDKPRVYGGIVDIGPYEYTGCTVSATVRTTQVTCKGLNNGTAIAQINGGVAPFTLSWSTGETATSLLGLSPGTYGLIVTDATGCTAVVGFNIKEPEPLQIGLQVFPASCGESNGSAVAFPTGGTSPYSYYWEGQQGNFGLTGIYAGDYALLIRDKNGCATDSSFTVPGPDSLKVDIHKKDLTCYQSDDGIIALHPYGGKGPFLIQWAHGSDKDSIHGLEPGIYTYTVTDDNLCFTTGSIMVSEPNEMKLALDVTNATCGAADGTATVITYQGGEFPFSYTWSNGDHLQKADSLTAGLYAVTVTDIKGCTATTTAEIDNINAPEIVTDQIKDVSCNGLHDGALNVSVSKGVPPYQYTWSTSSSSEDLSNLTAGAYSLTVTDANHCSAVKTFEIKQPDKLGVFLSVENTQCGLSEGVLNANVVGGTMPYSYKWSSGGDKAIEFDLPSGNYNVSVTDANGCHISKEGTVADMNGPHVQQDIVAPAGCRENDGFASVKVNGGIPPYTYLWSQGEINQTGFLDSLSAGIYEVTVIDASGCKHTAPIEINIKKPSVPNICVVTVDSLSGTNLVVWDKLALKGIEKYRIYKERYLAGYFELTGEIGQNSPAVFNDAYALPSQRSWKYKISAVDECNNESELSIYHETMHLTINASVNKDVNLIWNSYGGIAAGTYYINRYSRSRGWELIDSVPVSPYENKYTDFSPPPAHLTYYIGYKIPGGGCNPYYLKTTGNPFSQSISNLQESWIVTDLKDAESSETALEVYPNPFKEDITIDFDLQGSSDVNILITNQMGQVILKNQAGRLLQGPHSLRLDIPGPPGLYFVELQTGKTRLIKKLIKE
jgi:hypothetical protein